MATSVLPGTRLGLSDSEVRIRRESGKGNTAPINPTPSYGQIFRTNFVTFINVSLFLIAITLTVLGRPLDALSAAGLITFNALVGSAQEIRSKRTLERIAMIQRSRVKAIRDGVERVVGPEELVVGDLVKVEQGDQLVVDGRVVGPGQIVIDESLLTGESDYIPKREGDDVVSGSVCVSGSCVYEAEKVGADSLVSKFVSQAHAERQVLTPLQRQVHVVLGVTLLVALFMELLLVVRSFLGATNLASSVEQSAVIAGLVPDGLVLSIAVAYAISAIRVLRFGALAQQANAIESLSNVSVLCLDKTGTLTTNNVLIDRIESIGLSEVELRCILGDLAASNKSSRISDALATTLAGRPRPILAEVPFSPQRRWSAFALDDPGNGRNVPLHGVFVLGAPEVVQGGLSADGDARIAGMGLAAQAEEWSKEGLLTLLVAHSDDLSSLEDLGHDSKLPQGLIPIGLVGLREELRPGARETLDALREGEMEIKLVSGDHPQTVAAVAKSAGFVSDTTPVSGLDLDLMDEERLGHAAEEAIIFGRMTPAHKETLIGVLRKRGHYVAMVGDGVNDVLPLKEAQVGIAMHSGSAATRGVADMVLLNDSFATLGPAIAEGQRIVNGLQPTLKLFLTKISAAALVILASLAVAGVFPVNLRHGSILTLLTVGLPSVLLALWAKPGRTPRESLMRDQIHFFVPAAVLSGIIGLFLFYGALLVRIAPYVHQHPNYSQSQIAQVLTRVQGTAQTELTSFFVMTGLVLVIFVAPPTAWWVGGSALNGDRRPTWLAVGLMVFYGVILSVQPLRTLFGLSALGPGNMVLVLVGTVIWLFLVRLVWRSRLVERYLDLEEPATAVDSTTRGSQADAAGTLAPQDRRSSMSIVQAQAVHPAVSPGLLPTIRQHWRFISVEVALLIATLVMAVLVKMHPGPFAGDLSISVAWEKLIRPDHPLTTAVEFFGTITWQIPAIIIGAAIVAVFALFRRWLDIAIALGTFGLADGTNFVISRLVQRPRPFGPGLHVDAHVNVPSFPSGHVEHSLAFYGVVLFLTFMVSRPQAWLWIVRIPLILLIVMMGPSRLVTGEHWPSDVLAALFWGAFWLLLAIQVYPWAARRFPKLVPPNERRAPMLVETVPLDDRLPVASEP